MSDLVHDDVLDAALTLVRDHADALSVCTALPATVQQATASLALASRALAGGAFALGPAAGGGRQLLLAAQTDLEVTADGTARFLALTDSLGGRVLVVRPCAEQVLTAGNSVSVPELELAITEPA